jgi:fructokinase
MPRRPARTGAHGIGSGCYATPPVNATSSKPHPGATEEAGRARQVLYGAVEGGGTKFVCAAGRGPDRIVRRTRIDTTTAAETMAQVADFFADVSRDAPLAAVGVACFGPIEIDPARDGYGSLLPTPKPGWSGAPIVASLVERLGVPVALDTDVNGAALGEWRWGAAHGADPAVYLTVGTGIGGGAVVDGRPLHGLLHPEMGHIPIPRQRWPDGRLDDFAGVCPFHGDCFEGMASGPALQARLAGRAAETPPDDPVWEVEAAYLAAALATYVLVLSPRRIVLGGGVMQQEHLLPRVRRYLQQRLATYVPRTELAGAIDGYVVTPRFGQDAGLAGAFALAEQAASQHTAPAPA